MLLFLAEHHCICPCFPQETVACTDSYVCRPCPYITFLPLQLQVQGCCLWWNLVIQCLYMLMMFQNLHCCHILGFDALRGYVVLALQGIHILYVELAYGNTHIENLAIVLQLYAWQPFNYVTNSHIMITHICSNKVVQRVLTAPQLLCLYLHLFQQCVFLRTYPIYLARLVCYVSEFSFYVESSHAQQKHLQIAVDKGYCIVTLFVCTSIGNDGAILRIKN